MFVKLDIVEFLYKFFEIRIEKMFGLFFLVNIKF